MSKYDNRIKSRKENNRRIFKRSFLKLAGVNSPNEKTREDFIVHQLIRYYKIDNIFVPWSIKSLEDKIDFLINSNTLLSKKVELNGTWYLDYRDPLLVYKKESDTPILLIPSGQRHYYYVSYETGKKVIVTPLTVLKLKKEAYTFYKPLPSHKLTPKEYYRFFRKSVRIIDLVWVTLFSVLATAVAMVLPYIMKTITGDVVSNQDFNLFHTMAIYLSVAGVTYLLIKATQAFMNARVSIKIEKVMKETTMMRLLSLPLSFFRKYSTGELVERYNSVSSISTLMFNGVFLTALSSILSLGFITQIVAFSPSLILPVVLIIAINTSLMVFVSLMQTRVSRKQMLMQTKESGTSYSIINGIQKIRLAGAEKSAFEKWAKDYSRSSKLLYNPPLIIRLAPVLSLIITTIGAIVIYYIASINSLDLSSFVAFTTSYASLSASATMAAEISTTLSKLRPVLEMARPLIEEEPEDNERKKIVSNLKGNIKIDHVSFRYKEDGRDIIKDLSFDIKEGEYVGIVGKSGCGKSTLVRLLLGFEKLNGGHIYYDGEDINELNLQSLRSNIGTVTQNGGIFHADILSNILITAPDMDEKDAWRAAEISGISEDIKNMPMGMRTVISEGQGGISGGQKQRIMIARAIVNKPKILIFDEATSALDNKTQKSVSDSISELNCTRIVIAHRLSTIKECNRILYMENGEIVETGTYDELINKKGKFYNLLERQRLES